MPRGGRRPGAGRPKGSKSTQPTTLAKITLRMAAQMRATEYLDSGRDPLRVLIGLAYDENQPAELRLQAASAAAPYVHPKLVAQHVTTASLTAPIDGGAAFDKLMQRLGSRAAPQVQKEPEVIDHTPEQANDPADGDLT